MKNKLIIFSIFSFLLGITYIVVPTFFEKQGIITAIYLQSLLLLINAQSRIKKYIFSLLSVITTIILFYAFNQNGLSENRHILIGILLLPYFVSLLAYYVYSKTVKLNSENKTIITLSYVPVLILILLGLFTNKNNYSDFFLGVSYFVCLVFLKSQLNLNIKRYILFLVPLFLIVLNIIVTTFIYYNQMEGIWEIESYSNIIIVLVAMLLASFYKPKRRALL